MNNPKPYFRLHAIQRMFQRKISVRRVMQALQAGETIEDYSGEMAEPGRLILGFQGKRPFHVVVSENPELNEATIITVYIPSLSKWKKDFRTRKA